LYGLDAIADVLDGKPGQNGLTATMETLMVEQPNTGPATMAVGRRRALAAAFQLQRSDPLLLAGSSAHLPRSRNCSQRLPGDIPETLISQHLGRSIPAWLQSGSPLAPRELCLAAIDAALAPIFSRHGARHSTERPVSSRISEYTTVFSRRELWRQ
jgi:tagatose-1,6-bisphosphate aldolase non-catalytic subunit AgaZ/GatZ